MRDIGARIQRYRLSRYGNAGGSRFRWAWPLLLLWMIYATFLGQHSLLRIWLMGIEEHRAQAELATVRQEQARLEQVLHDPSRLRDWGEQTLRGRNGFVGRGERIYRIPQADSLDD
jgi:cell division protein FtsB